MPTNPRNIVKVALKQHTLIRKGKEVRCHYGRLWDRDGKDRQFTIRISEVTGRVAEDLWTDFKKEHMDTGESTAPEPAGFLPDHRARFPRVDLDDLSSPNYRMKLAELRDLQIEDAYDPDDPHSDSQQKKIDRSWKLFWKFLAEECNLPNPKAIYLSDITAEIADRFAKWVLSNTNITRENYPVGSLDAAWNKWARGQSHERDKPFRKGKTDRGHPEIDPNPWLDVSSKGTGPGRQKGYFRPVYIAQILKYLWSPECREKLGRSQKDHLWWTVFIMLMCETGCRRTEIVHLPVKKQIRWDPEHTTIDLLERKRTPIPGLSQLDWIPWATKQINLAKSRKVEISPEVLAKSLRKDIPISPMLARFLKIHIARLENHQAYLFFKNSRLTEINERMRIADTDHQDKRAWNFGDNGSEQTQAGTYTVFLNFIQIPAKIPDDHLRRLHEFRHTFIRRCKERGVQEVEAAELIGDSPECVAEAYRIWDTDRDHKLAWSKASPFARSAVSEKAHYVWQPDGVWDTIYAPIMGELESLERENSLETPKEKTPAQGAGPTPAPR